MYVCTHCPPASSSPCRPDRASAVSSFLWRSAITELRKSTCRGPSVTRWQAQTVSHPPVVGGPRSLVLALAVWSVPPPVCWTGKRLVCVCMCGWTGVCVCCGCMWDWKRTTHCLETQGSCPLLFLLDSSTQTQHKILVNMVNHTPIAIVTAALLLGKLQRCTYIPTYRFLKLECIY